MLAIEVVTFRIYLKELTGFSVSSTTPNFLV